jgi:4-methyl-5(b-hydroxyethyl)-thiazole monophosphate biosynthesis
VDILRRAGVHVELASVTASTVVTLSRGVRIMADSLLTDHVTKKFDVIVCPGGLPGAVSDE